MSTFTAPPNSSFAPLEAAYEVLTPFLCSTDASEAIISAKCSGLLAGYHEKWKTSDLQIVSVERVVFADLYNPTTGRTSRTFRVGGKLDVTARDPQGRYLVIDHKTTSEDITDPNAPYWRQLVIEGQVSHYMMLEWLNGRKVDYAIWDVIRKPGISPKILSKKDREATYHTKQYYGLRLDDESLEQFLSSDRETAVMYAARLAHDCTTERPYWYFQRRQVPRLDQELHEYARDQWDVGQEILNARNTDRHLRNSGACMLYGRPCQFLGICSGYDTPESPNWSRKPQVHLELPIENSDGRDILTNSRMRCFQTCRKRHFFEYELGIQRVDQEEREALVFGHMFHQALEAYLLTLQHQQEAI